MTTAKKTSGKRGAAKRKLTTSTAPRRNARGPAQGRTKSREERSPRSARNAHDTTRKSASKRRASVPTKREIASSKGSALTRTRAALAQVSHTREQLEGTLVRAPRQIFRRARAFADRGRELVDRVKLMLSDWAHAAHLPRKRTA